MQAVAVLIMACIQILTLLYVVALIAMLVITNVKPYISHINSTSDTIDYSNTSDHSTDVAELGAWHYAMVINQIVIWVLGKLQTY